jgi:uncharacterized protein (TIGR03382 family)
LHTLVVFGVTACAAPTIDDDLEYGEVSSEISVGATVDRTCSTASVRGLSKQIAEEVDCMSPSSLVRFSPSTRIKFSSNAVLPYLHARAKADLLRVAESHKLVINSGYRTVAQQYLLYRWHRAGRCGIRAAALPGRSNHESGRAIDLANWSTRVSAMAKHNWSHSVPGDPVHFDNTRSPDNRGKDVRAFQRLWNRNRPNDKITVDGIYGPQTAARLKRAPATGFKKGAFCRSLDRGADVLAIDGPDRLGAGDTALYDVTLANNDDTDWAATTRIVVADGSASELYDPATWTSPSEVGKLGVAIAGGGGEGKVTIVLRAPLVDDEGSSDVTLRLIDPDGYDRGTFDLAVTVTPADDAGASGEAGEQHDHEPLGDEELADEDGVVTGGCSAAGGGAGWSLLGLVGLAIIARRRGTRARRDRSSRTANRRR